MGKVTSGPYEVPYQVMLPSSSESTNLLVAVALSASHVAYCSVRMEPNFLVLGQSAGVAAAQAAKTAAGTGGFGMVHEVDLVQMHADLLASGQVLHP